MIMPKKEREGIVGRNGRTRDKIMVKAFGHFGDVGKTMHICKDSAGA